MKQYHYQTISRKVLGDLHTPVSTYLKVRTSSRKVPSWRARTITGVKTTVHSSVFVPWQVSVSIMAQPYSACPTVAAKS